MGSALFPHLCSCFFTSCFVSFAVLQCLRYFELNRINWFVILRQNGALNSCKSSRILGNYSLILGPKLELDLTIESDFSFASIRNQYLKNPLLFFLTVCVLLLIAGKVILESVILSTRAVLSFTLFTFWVTRKGYDFKFLGPFLFGAFSVLILFALIQILFLLDKISVMIYGSLASIIFCGYIVYDTDNLIKRYSYDEYIWATVSLYLDIINLFFSLLTIFRAVNS